MRWSLGLGDAGKTLVVDLRVENLGAEPIWVCDGLLKHEGQGWGLTNRLIVSNGKVPGEVSIKRGPISGTRPSTVIPPASYRKVEAGAVHEEQVQLPWPEAWNPLGADPLVAPMHAANLMIAYFVGEPPSWAERPAADGSTLRLPEGYSMRWFDGGTQPLPK